MFADDSTGNIKSSIMVCNTLYMAKRKGLDNHDFNYIWESTHGLSLGDGYTVGPWQF